jgi:hypothetical protein
MTSQSECDSDRGVDGECQHIQVGVDKFIKASLIRAQSGEIYEQELANVLEKTSKR